MVDRALARCGPITKVPGEGVRRRAAGQGTAEGRRHGRITARRGRRGGRHERSRRHVDGQRRDRNDGAVGVGDHERNGERARYAVRVRRVLADRCGAVAEGPSIAEGGLAARRVGGESDGKRSRAAARRNRIRGGQGGRHVHRGLCSRGVVLRVRHRQRGRVRAGRAVEVTWILGVRGGAVAQRPCKGVGKRPAAGGTEEGGRHGRVPRGRRGACPRRERAGHRDGSDVRLDLASDGIGDGQRGGEDAGGHICVTRVLGVARRTVSKGPLVAIRRYAARSRPCEVDRDRRAPGDGRCVCGRDRTCMHRDDDVRRCALSGCVGCREDGRVCAGRTVEVARILHAVRRRSVAEAPRVCVRWRPARGEAAEVDGQRSITCSDV